MMICGWTICGAEGRNAAAAADSTSGPGPDARRGPAAARRTGPRHCLRQWRYPTRASPCAPAVRLAEPPYQGKTTQDSVHRITCMATRLVQVNIKARDDAALGRFWADALGWGVSSEGPGVTNVEPVGFVGPDPIAVCVDVVTV